MVPNGQPVRFMPLDPALAGAVEGMTFPRFRHLLSLTPAPRYPSDGDRVVVQPVGVVAMASREPVGLSLAAIPRDEPGTAEVLSLFVHREWRGRGLATELLARMEAVLAAAGIGEVQGTYSTGKASTAVLEHVLRTRGWEPPVVRTVSVRFTPDEARATPWYNRTVMPRGAEILAWRDVTPDEKQRIIESHKAERWIADGLEPWVHEQVGYEPASSLAMRYKGDIVGWVINHRVTPDTVRFTLSFMRPDLSRRAAILPLYRASIERVRDAGYRYCTFVTPVKYQGMVDFIVNHCARWIGFVGETRGVWKRLRPTTGVAPEAE
jgi:GNAT superfamily N-acetyltransferase